VSEIVAFTADHVCRLTGLSAHQLRYWDATDFFSPTLLNEHRRRTFGRIYAFRDLVGLRVIAMLRNTHGVPLQELRKVGAWLQARHNEPWSSLRFSVAGKRVFFHDPDTGVPTEPKGEGQRVLNIALQPIANEMRDAASRLRDRSTGQIGKIDRNRYVVHNAHVAAGTRIPTTAIWNLREAGYPTKAILCAYPRLRLKDIRAALHFEARRRRSAA
jgi:DNA-binding transcriptional MerR regulator